MMELYKTKTSKKIITIHKFPWCSPLETNYKMYKPCNCAQTYKLMGQKPL